MTFTQLLRVLRQYDTLLGGPRHEFEPKRGNPETLIHQGVELGEHTRWMCQEMLRLLDTGPPLSEKMEKAMRWLGFVQGVLWATGLRTIDEMRKDNSSRH